MTATTDIQVVSWLNRLGLPHSPQFVRQNLRTALDFFATEMPTLPQSKIQDYLRGIDLHSDVRIQRLEKGETFISFRRPSQTYLGNWYAKSGTPMQRLGINPSDRLNERFRVRSPARALVSRAAGVRDTWTVTGTTYLAGGQGEQYLIGSPTEHLEVFLPPSRG